MQIYTKKTLALIVPDYFFFDKVKISFRRLLLEMSIGYTKGWSNKGKWWLRPSGRSTPMVRKTLVTNSVQYKRLLSAMS